MLPSDKPETVHMPHDALHSLLDMHFRPRGMLEVSVVPESTGKELKSDVKLEPVTTHIQTQQYVRLDQEADKKRMNRAK